MILPYFFFVNIFQKSIFFIYENRISNFKKALPFIIFGLGNFLALLTEIFFSYLKDKFFQRKILEKCNNNVLQKQNSEMEKNSKIKQSQFPTNTHITKMTNTFSNTKFLKKKNDILKKIINKDESGFSIKLNTSFGLNISANIQNLSKIELELPIYTDEESIITVVEKEKKSNFDLKNIILYVDIFIIDFILFFILLNSINNIKGLIFLYPGFCYLSILLKVKKLYKQFESKKISEEIYRYIYYFSFCVFPVLFFFNFLLSYFNFILSFDFLNFFFSGFFFKIIFFDVIQKEIKISNQLYYKLGQLIFGTVLGIHIALYVM